MEFEPTISAGERPQTYALDRAATGTGNNLSYILLKWEFCSQNGLIHVAAGSIYYSRQHSFQFRTLHLRCWSEYGVAKMKNFVPYIVHTWWCHTLQNKQCTYYITLWRVCVTSVAMDKVISITYSECAPVALIISIQCACAFLYCHLWPAWPYHISPHYIINGTVFERKKEKKILNINVRFDFLYYFCH